MDIRVNAKIEENLRKEGWNRHNKKIVDHILQRHRSWQVMIL